MPAITEDWDEISLFNNHLYGHASLLVESTYIANI